MHKIFTLLTALLSLCVLTYGGHNEFRIIEVDPDLDQVIIQNISDSQSDIGQWWLNSELKNASIIGNLTSSSTLLDSKEKLVLTFPIDDEIGDIALFEANDFSDYHNIRDFLQWGASIQANEIEADKAGIWRDGDFIDQQGPFSFIGNIESGDHGEKYWSNPGFTQRELSSDDVTSRLYPNPITTIATLALNIDLELTDVEVHIYNLLGKEVKRYADLKDHFITFNRQDLLKGVYFYSISKEGKVLDTVKFKVN